ncbi:glutaredoxin family protein [uncultured Microbacterium sp.]|uniref:glutaredoxin family protein n=1 Tax=uncultured Microbacterium sp. TaxID=191216 RepID=UPI000C46705F|nr:glutaredoxin family protein [uncultured Microbacterium sp.]MAM53968.1 NrdH-redoxin [Microbacterium sp.]
MTTVRVYSTGPDCVRCTLTCSCLRDAGVPFEVVDLTIHTAALTYVRDTLGYAEAPVVVVETTPARHWAGFRPDLIAQLASSSRMTT